jgi:hypothetical protein
MVSGVRVTSVSSGRGGGCWGWCEIGVEIAVLGQHRVDFSHEVSGEIWRQIPDFLDPDGGCDPSGEPFPIRFFTHRAGLWGGAFKL